MSQMQATKLMTAIASLQAQVSGLTDAVATISEEQSKMKGTIGPCLDSTTQTAQDHGEKKKQGPFALFVEYSKTSTCHGLSYIFRQDAGSVSRRFWSFVYFLCVCTWFFLSCNAVMMYYTYTVSSTIKQHYVSSLPFPAVTFCTKNRLKKSFVMPLIENGTIPDYRSLNHYIRQQIRLGNLNITTLSGNFTNEDLDKLDKVLLKTLQAEFDKSRRQVDWENLILQGGHEFEESVSNSKYFDFTSFIHPVLRALCHTATFSHYNWSAGKYLRLWLHILEHEYLEDDRYNPSGVKGFRVIIHPRNHFPNSRKYNSISNDKDSHTLKMTKKDVRKLPSPYSDCENDDGKHALKYLNYSYSRDACIVECESEALMQHFGCRWPGRLGDRPLCNMTGLQDTGRFHRHEHKIGHCVHCPPACHTTTYGTDLISKGKKGSDTLSLTIAFTDSSYEEIREIPTYPAASMIAEIGGLLGLFVGASLLTLMEFVELFSVCWLGRCRFVRGCQGGDDERNHENDDDQKDNAMELNEI